MQVSDSIPPSRGCNPLDAWRNNQLFGCCTVRLYLRHLIPVRHPRLWLRSGYIREVSGVSPHFFPWDSCLPFRAGRCYFPVRSPICVQYFTYGASTTCPPLLRLRCSFLACARFLPRRQYRRLIHRLNPSLYTALYSLLSVHALRAAADSVGY